MNGRLVLMAIALVGFATPSFAQSISVERAWAEQEGVGRGDMFFVIKNTGSANDRLYAVKTKIAKESKLEANSEEEADAGDEKEVLGIDIPAGTTTELSEDGPHIEMFGVTEDLVADTVFSATLYFEEAGQIKVDVTVED